MKKISLILSGILVLIGLGSAGAYQTENVIVVSVCGVRNSEFFDDPSHQYIPNIWNDLKPLAVINKGYQTFVEPSTVSCHYALVSGTWSGFVTSDLGLDQERFRLHEPTMFEYFRKSFDLPETAVFAITGAEGKLLHEDYSIHPLYGKNYKATLVNRTADILFDYITRDEIFSAMDTYQPRLIFATFKGSDLYGHGNNWDGYLSNIAKQDQLITELWNKIESEPAYAGKTTMIIIGDHGRHDDDHGGFQDHGGPYLDDGSRYVPFMAIGPDFKTDLLMNIPRKLIDLVPTIGELLGFDTPFVQGRVMWELFEIGSSPSPPPFNVFDRTVPSLAIAGDKIHLAFQNTSKLIQNGNEEVFYYNVEVDNGERSSANRLSGQHLLSVNPAIAANEDGLHLIYTGWLPTDGSYQNDYDWQNVFYRKSADNGNSWSEPVQINPKYEVKGMLWIEKPKIAAEGNNLAVTIPWHRTDIDVMVSTDAGDTWSVTGFDARVPRAAVPVIDGNTLRVVYHDNETFSKAGGNRDLYFLENNDITSSTWEANKRLTTDVANDINPDMEINGETIHIVWESDRSGFFQIYYMNSLDGGNSWNIEQQLTESPVGAQNAQVSLVGNKLAVSWIDYQDGKGNIFLKYSPDNGATWTDNTQYTETTADIRHLDMETNGEKIYLAWEVKRNGQWEIDNSPGLEIPVGQTPPVRTWTQVIDGGFGDPDSEEINSMVVFQDNLYVGTWNSTRGAEVLKYNGSNWEQINTDGFGDVENIATLTMVVFNDELYAGTNNPTSGAQIWKYDGSNWSDVSPPSEETNGVWAMRVFQGNIYAGIGSINDGAEVWRFDGVNWEQLAAGGFDDPGNKEHAAMAVFNNQLYVGTWNPDTGGEVWKYDGVVWTQVNEDGFGDTEPAGHTVANQGIWSMHVFQGNLYVGVGNISTGAEIWKYDGSVWTQVNEDGFGDKSNFGPWSMNLFLGDQNMLNLYVGVGNMPTGATLWRYDGATWSQANTDGFGDPDNDVIRWMCTFQNSLYAGTWNKTSGMQLWKYGFNQRPVN